MDKIKKVDFIRSNLKKGKVSLGSWLQISNTSVAEILGDAGYDWIAIDMEHASIGYSKLPDLCRALELNNTLPLVRLIEGSERECKQALDSGAGGLIIPMIKSAEQLMSSISASCWPPRGTRGVGFSRANLFGKNFETYSNLAQKPLIIAMIENINAIQELDKILDVPGLDSIFIGPYDLSASMGMTGNFKSREFKSTLNEIKLKAMQKNIPLGIHIVQPDIALLHEKIKEGYQFIAYSIDSVMLIESVKKPSIIKR